MAFVNGVPVLRSSRVALPRAGVCTQVKTRVPNVKNRSARSRLPVRAVATGNYVREVSGEQLDEAVKANARPIVLDAYADWCGPCKILAGELQELSGRFGDSIDILKLDTEKHGDLASAMMIRGLPTVMFIKDTTLLFRTEGAVPADDLESLVNYFFFDGPKPEGLQVRPREPGE